MRRSRTQPTSRRSSSTSAKLTRIAAPTASPTPPPASATLLQRAAERGHNLGTITAALLRLLDRYGAVALEAAIGCALEQGVPHPNAVRLALERAREERGLPPPTALHLSENVARRDAPVRSHALASYDRIAQAEAGDLRNE